MFETLRLHGGPATLVYGYSPAAWLGSWRITRHEGRWTLRATIDRVDGYNVRRRPLLLAVPRKGGFWTWPIVSLEMNDRQLRATLGPPEH